MALQGSGAISLLNLATEFGGTAPHSMSEYYLGGGLVSSNNTNVPTSGAIGLSDFYGAFAAIVLDITSNTSDYNILTAATAAGYNAATDTTPIIVNVAAGVDITATSGNSGITTGALNAASDVTINIAATATVCGFDGAQGANGGINTAGSAGGNGTDAILFAITSGTGTYAVVNSGTVGGGSGGGGGAGGGGSAGARYTETAVKGGYDCTFPNVYGSNGSSGTAGTSGTSCQAQNGTSGTAGTSGTYPVQVSPCSITVTAGSGGAGGAGGTAGKAVNFGGLTVSASGGGTYYGATS